MHCIVSGFDSFGGHASNPSQLVVEALPQSIITTKTNQTIKLTKLVLESCCDKAWNTLQDQLCQLPDPSVPIILTGLAERRNRIGLERFALNIRDYRIPDNFGHQWTDQPIDDNGPEAIRTDLPLPVLSQQLNNLGFLCEISNHAGSYLCNEVYYRCLNFKKNSGYTKTILFVHFPLPESYACLCLQEGLVFERAGIPENLKTTALKIFGYALVEIIKFCCTVVPQPQNIQ
ncbi:MAG: hypothetical protein HY711_09450 [Candidatus Melainabacteria bacterium]|nr:hypothetical protein [Candidatus Melainabacteria bacterium]